MPTIALERQIHANLQIGRPDGITWEDVTDYLASVSVELGDISGIGTGQSGVDGVVRRMTFTLRNDRVLHVLIWSVDGIVSSDRVLSGDDTVYGAAKDGSWLARLLNQEPDYYGDSFAPRDRLSAWNTFGGSYAPLLWPNREVVLQVAVTDPGVEPQASDWVTLFHGLLGDSIRTSGPTVTCDARDLAKRLQDAYILTPREYGSEAGTPAEDVIQQIIDDNLGEGEVTLYFPSGTASDPRPIAESPGFMVTPYVVEYMSVWDAIQQVVAQFGWFLGYRWHPNTGRMQLILMEPPRNKDASTADFYLSWEDDIYTQDLEITDSDIRNIVTVTYRNADTGDRESVTVQDDTSIATYGPRAMQIEEGDASLIDTPEEAERLANAALADLKDMTATTQLNLPLLPTLDVFSGIVVTDPRLSSTDDFFGVESVRHVLDFEARQFRTEVVASGRVIGGHHRWLRMQTRPGAKPPVRTGDIAPEAVDTPRLADGATTTDKIAEQAITGLEILQVTDNIGVISDSQTFVDIPGFSIEFYLEEPAMVFFFASLEGFAYFRFLIDDALGANTATAFWRMMVDGSFVPGSLRQLLIDLTRYAAGTETNPGFTMIGSTIAIMAARYMDAGWHEVKVQHRLFGLPPDPERWIQNVRTHSRILGVLVFKR